MIASQKRFNFEGRKEGNPHIRKWKYPKATRYRHDITNEVEALLTKPQNLLIICDSNGIDANIKKKNFLQHIKIYLMN